MNYGELYCNLFEVFPPNVKCTAIFRAVDDAVALQFCIVFVSRRTEFWLMLLAFIDRFIALLHSFTWHDNITKTQSPQLTVESNILWDLPVNFYRASYALCSICHGPVSVCVCLSQVRVLQKQLNVGWRKQRRMIAQGLQFSVPKMFSRFERGQLQRGHQMQVG